MLVPTHKCTILTSHKFGLSTHQQHMSTPLSITKMPKYQPLGACEQTTMIKWLYLSYQHHPLFLCIFVVLAYLLVIKLQGFDIFLSPLNRIGGPIKKTSVLMTYHGRLGPPSPQLFLTTFQLTWALSTMKPLKLTIGTPLSTIIDY